MARRDDREYWAYLREEQRRQPGCPARELCRESLFLDTSLNHQFVRVFFEQPAVEAT